MLNIAILSILLFCNWHSFNQEELHIDYQGAMISNLDQMKIEGMCGGTETYQVQFESFEYCKTRKKLNVVGTVKDKTTQEPSPFCFIANAEIEQRLLIKSEVAKTDSLGKFDIEIRFHKNDKLAFYGLGAQIILISMPD